MSKTISTHWYISKPLRDASWRPLQRHTGRPGIYSYNSLQRPLSGQKRSGTISHFAVSLAIEVNPGRKNTCDTLLLRTCRFESCFILFLPPMTETWQWRWLMSSHYWHVDCAKKRRLILERRSRCFSHPRQTPMDPVYWVWFLLQMTKRYTSHTSQHVSHCYTPLLALDVSLL